MKMKKIFSQYNILVRKLEHDTGYEEKNQFMYSHCSFFFFKHFDVVTKFSRHILTNLQDFFHKINLIFSAFYSHESIQN